MIAARNTMSPAELFQPGRRAVGPFSICGSLRARWVIQHSGFLVLMTECRIALASPSTKWARRLCSRCSPRDSIIPSASLFDRDGHVWAGGEAGQVYRIDASGAVKTVTTLGGFIAGIAFSPLDHSLYVCNAKLGLVRVDADGRHALFATEAEGHKIVCPNYPVFDRRGRLYVSDSGKWKQQ